MTIRPRDLPGLRSQTVKALEDPTGLFRSRIQPPQEIPLDVIIRVLRAAELYWVTDSMTALAMSAGVTLTDPDWGPQARPSGCGLIYYQGGIGSIPILDGTIEQPVDACGWGPGPGGRCLLTFFGESRRTAQAIRDTGKQARPLPPGFIPVASAYLVTGQGPTDAGGHPTTDLPAPLVSAVAASWLLMQQPQLADRSTRPAKGPDRAAARRLGMPDPQVSIVDLRRQYRPDDREETGEDRGRRYKHRWVVSGHWRNQPYGPGRSLRRKQWIPAHVRGPDGAPLLATEKVNVWRR